MIEPVALSRLKLFEQVAAHIERQILEGALRPGDRLPTERELQARFGVGRPAVREALITLQRAGLIEISNGAPARVSMPTASDVVAGMMPAVLQMLSTEDGQHHFQRVRMFFECGLARQAAREANEAQIEKLRAALAANEAAIGNRDAFTATDIAFHFVLAEMTGNPVFIALHDAMSAWLRQQRTVTLERQGQDQVAFRAHERIYDAIKTRNSDSAEEAMRDHLLQLEEAYWRKAD